MCDWICVKEIENGKVYATACVPNTLEVIKLLLNEPSSAIVLYVTQEEIETLHSTIHILRSLDLAGGGEHEGRFLMFACAKDDNTHAFEQMVKAHIEAIFGPGMALKEARNVLKARMSKMAPDMETIFDKERRELERL